MAPDERRDLAAMVVALGRALTAAEQPVLRAHGVSMWAYIVLTALAERPRRTQAALARDIGADKTRIIGVLDDLQGRGLIERRPDPADRRVHVLSLTAAGRRTQRVVQSAIRAREERLLARLTGADRRGFLHALGVLSALPPEEIAEEP